MEHARNQWIFSTFLRIESPFTPFRVPKELLFSIFFFINLLISNICCNFAPAFAKLIRVMAS